VVWMAWKALECLVPIGTICSCLRRRPVCDPRHCQPGNAKRVDTRFAILQACYEAQTMTAFAVWLGVTLVFVTVQVAVAPSVQVAAPVTV